MRHAFLLQRCLRSSASECEPFRLKTVVRIVIPELTRASTATRAVNRGEVAHVSKGTNYDAIPVYSPAGSIITPLQTRLHLKPPQRGKCLRSVQSKANRPALPSGMSGSMMPSLRRGMLNKQEGRTRAVPPAQEVPSGQILEAPPELAELPLMPIGRRNHGGDLCGKLRTLPSRIAAIGS
jgi:hypothetical protein